MGHESLGFSAFRELLDQWDQHLERENLEQILHGGDISFFFTRGDEIFGAPEESRLTYARMKNPDEEDDEGWAKEASFAGVDIARAIKGETVQKVFSFKDIPEIKIIDKDAVEKKFK
jgi:hypothetical protein